MRAASSTCSRGIRVPCGHGLWACAQTRVYRHVHRHVHRHAAQTAVLGTAPSERSRRTLGPCIGSISASLTDSEAVILSSSTPIPAHWACRRRCRDRADIELGAVEGLWARRHRNALIDVQRPLAGSAKMVWPLVDVQRPLAGSAKVVWPLVDVQRPPLTTVHRPTRAWPGACAVDAASFSWPRRGACRR